MDLVKDVRIGLERAETGVGAEIDRPAVILDARKISRVGIAEYASAEGDEARKSLWFRNRFRHSKIYLASRTSAMNTSKGLMVRPRGGLAVFKRSALENRICRS